MTILWLIILELTSCQEPAKKKTSEFITDNLKSSVQYVPKLQPEHAPYSVWSEETSNALTVKTLARSQEWMILLFAH